MAEPAVQERLITAEEFWLMPKGEGRSELVDGRVVEMPPVGPDHGRLDSRIARRLDEHLERVGTGGVYINTGFILRNDPDHVRAPDLAFVSAERAATHPKPARGYWPVAPDLAVEIVSPDDRAEDIAEKIDDYLAAGVRLIWVVYPRRRCVHVFVPGQPIQALSGEAVLNGGEVLPGFELPLSELWQLVQG
ncbi:MAG: Uma2 family endonuclease [Armatimonadetes bacterium]|nr:Uma2 family endonuclease [Armatimonadota bacterium]